MCNFCRRMKSSCRCSGQCGRETQELETYQSCTRMSTWTAPRDLTQSSVSVELVKLPHDGYLDFIDTGLHLTIGQIRQHLRKNFDMPRVRLVYNGRELTDDSRNLADYGWTSGECGKIKIQDTVIYTNEIN